MKRNSSKHNTNIWIILSLAALVIVLGGAIYYYVTTNTNTQEQKVESSTIGTGDILLSATGLGTLASREEVSFGFKNDGAVSEILVSLGDQVEAGQVLARLEKGTLSLRYKKAEAELGSLSSPAEIAKAEQAVQDAKLSFATARNDLEYLIGPDMLSAEESVASAQQILQTAKSSLEQDASDTNKQKVSEAEANLKKARESLTYAYYNHSSTYTQETFTYPIRNDKGVTIRRDLIAPTDAELLEARAAYELAAANLSDTRNFLDVLKGVKETNTVPASSVSSITEAKLAFDTARANLEATELIAPINGTVTAIDLKAGDKAGISSIITISDLNQPYLIDAFLDETDWDKARVGLTANVTFDLLPDNSYSGKIIQVYPKLDDSSGTSMVHILVQLDETVSKDLPIGSTASVEVTGGEALGTVLVPVSALKEVEPGKYVVYIMKDGSPVEQEVAIGLQDILYAEVKSGLTRGDVVLTDATTINQ